MSSELLPRVRAIGTQAHQKSLIWHIPFQTPYEASKVFELDLLVGRLHLAPSVGLGGMLSKAVKALFCEDDFLHNPRNGICVF